MNKIYSSVTPDDERKKLSDLVYRGAAMNMRLQHRLFWIKISQQNVCKTGIISLFKVKRRRLMITFYEREFGVLFYQ